MAETEIDGFEELVGLIDRALAGKGEDQVASQVKKILEDVICSQSVRLPPAMKVAQSDRYARRLLYRSSRYGYEVIALIWGPGQGTPLHDHAGIWCVDGVLAGCVEVTQYDLLQVNGDLCRFQPQQTVRAGVGMAGCLIPPFEYHTIHNAIADANSITIHVYGGTMDHCTVFEPVKADWFRRRQKELTYSQ